jgi:hypothetical protein
MAYPTSSIGCDCDPADGRIGHPRGYGTFPRALGRYVRELGVVAWEDAIRKMTALPAATIGMVDRGIIAPGMVADLVVFDPATIIDRATFLEPDLPSEGVHHVMLAGEWGFRDGVATDVRAGRSLVRSTNMPARPDRTGAVQRLAFVGSFSGEDGAMLEARIDLEQAVGQGGAVGAFQVTAVSGGYSFAPSAIGVLQTAPGWASVTGTVVLPSLGERVFLLIVDTLDPNALDAGTTIVLEIEGMEPIRSRSPNVASVTR